MALNSMYFQPMTYQQANPVMAGLQAGQQFGINNLDAAAQVIKNQFLAPSLQQSLNAQKIANALQQNTLNYAPRMSAADLAQKQALPQLTYAQAAAQRALPGLYGAEGAADYARANQSNVAANLTREQTPYLVQKSAADVYSDPTISRLKQLQMAMQPGGINPNLLSVIGYGNQPQNQQSSVPGAPTYSNGFSLANPNLSTNPNISPSVMGQPKAYTGDAATNFALFGSPFSPMQMAGMQAQAKSTGETGVTNWNDAQSQAQKDSDIANTTIPLLDQFKNNYAKSTYVGKLSDVPITGWKSAISGNTAPEQAADNASQNIAATVAKLIAGGRVTNYEMQYINQLKPNRAMSPATAEMATNFLKAKMQQLGEQQNFLNAARNAGIDVQTAQTLWQNYRTQREPYNFSTNQVNTNLQNSWRDYLNPTAVNAVRNGQNYVPIPTFSNKDQFKNWYSSLPATDKAIVKQQVQGAR